MTLRLPLTMLADDLAAGKLCGFCGVFFRDDEDHADAHVEDLVQFLVVNPCRRSQQLEERRDGPRAELDFRVDVLRAARAGCCR